MLVTTDMFNHPFRPFCISVKPVLNLISVFPFVSPLWFPFYIHLLILICFHLN